MFHPHEIFRVLGQDRYTSLKIRVVLLDVFLAIAPLFIVITISYFWFQNTLAEDFYKQLQWEIQNTKQTIEFFVDGRLAARKFITSTYSYEQLSDHACVSKTISNFSHMSIAEGVEAIKAV